MEHRKVAVASLGGDPLQRHPGDGCAGDMAGAEGVSGDPLRG